MVAEKSGKRQSYLYFTLVIFRLVAYSMTLTEVIVDEVKVVRQARTVFARSISWCRNVASIWLAWYMSDTDRGGKDGGDIT